VTTVDNYADAEDGDANRKAKEDAAVTQANAKDRVMAIATSTPISTFSITIIVSSLFLDDLRLAMTSKSSDGVFFAIFVVFLFVFLVEFIVYSWAMPGYFGGFYFYLDASSDYVLGFLTHGFCTHRLLQHCR